jgi:hypothetical protein
MLLCEFMLFNFPLFEVLQPSRIPTPETSGIAADSPMPTQLRDPQMIGLSQGITFVGLSGRYSGGALPQTLETEGL